MLLPFGPGPRCIRPIVSFVFAGTAVASLSCTPPSSSSGSAPSVSTPATSSSLSIKSTSPVPSASPASATCRLGTGTLEGECRRLADQLLVGDVNAAIDRLAQRHPEYFNLDDTAGPGEWRVLQVQAYLDGLVQELRTAGFCAETDRASMVSVKNSNDASEDYHLFQYDQTHILTVLGNVSLGRGWSSGVRFRYVTGSPYLIDGGMLARA